MTRFDSVAPYVGAWVETKSACGNLLNGLVAPYVGAWVETFRFIPYTRSITSHLTWVRGLKR